MPFPFPCALVVLPAIMLLICGAFTINQLPAADWTPQKRSEVSRIWIIGGVVSAAYILLLFIARAVLASP